jgi:hypothetical protein
MDMYELHVARSLFRALIVALFVTEIGCSADDSSPPGGGGAGGTAGAGGNATQTTGGTGGTAGTGGNATQGAGGTGGTTGAGGSAAGATADGSAGTGGADGSTDSGGDGSAGSDGSRDGSSDAPSLGDVINGTPDGGAYSRMGWTATSVPPFPTGVQAQNQDLKYSNAFDGNYNTRWSIGDTNSPAQTLGDQFTFDMLEPHVFRRILFWAGGLNGVNGPDPRDYPGALDVSVSNDGTTFGAAIGSGMEPQPGCNTCTMPFTITLAQPAVARYVRLTLTRRLQLGGGIWWAISELYVYP